MTVTTITKIPFPGFYDSMLSSEIDHVAESGAESFVERQDEEGIPPELRLDAEAIGVILNDVTDYSAEYNEIAAAYVEGFDMVASERIGFPLELKYESMTSPRYYNFETDRVFAHIPMKIVKKLFAVSKKENHRTLENVIRERFTSRSGFISHYSNEIRTWLVEPLKDWDHNEIETLLLAVLKINESKYSDRIEWYVFDYISEAFYEAYSNAVDWDKFEAAVKERREELLEEIKKDDPNYEPPAPRCSETLELPFNDRR